MSANWAHNLDMLAQNGVLDFDGAAFVTGQAPRYVGRPCCPPSPYVGPIPPAPQLNQPQVDEFKQQKPQLPKENKKDDDMIKNPAWKKWAFGILAAGGLILLGVKAKSIIKWTKDLLNGKKFKGKFKWSNIKTYVSDKWKAFTKWTSKQWDKFTKLFKKKP